MSSAFWAIKAAKKKDKEFVPGTSKWVANELHLINTHVLTYTERQYQDVSESISSMNEFMSRVLKSQDDKHAFLDDLDGQQNVPDTPSSFTYISPSHKSRRTLNQMSQKSSSPIKGEKFELHTKTPSPLRIQSTRSVSSTRSASPNHRERERSSEEKFNSNNHESTESRKEEENTIGNVAPGLEDSFRAISTAIRKSIADKSLIMRHNEKDVENPTSKVSYYGPSKTAKDQDPKSVITPKETVSTAKEVINTLPDAYQNIAEMVPSNNTNRKSSYSKTPKRNSIFVSLPSREPIPVVSSGKSARSNRSTIIRTRTSRVFDKFDTVSKHSEKNESKRISGDDMTPVRMQKRNLVIKDNNIERYSSTNTKNEEDNERRKEVHKQNTRQRSSTGFSTPDNDDRKLIHNDPFQSNKNERTHTENNFLFKEKVKNDFELGSDGPSDATNLAYSNISEGIKLNGTQPKRATPIKETKMPNDSIGTIESVLRRARNALLNTSQKINSHPTSERSGLRVSNIPILSSSKISKETSQNGGTRAFLDSNPVNSSLFKSPTKSLAKSPTRAQTGSQVMLGTTARIRSPTRSTRSTSKSPIRSPKKASMVKMREAKSGSTHKDGDNVSQDQKVINGASESELINRLMTPTSSSAAKSSILNGSKSQSTSKSVESKKSEPFQSKNRFLTTTLNPSNVPVFNQIKPLTNTKVTNNHVSPTKKNYNSRESQESKIPLKLESHSTPYSKKKSLMAERSEAAAQKPKQKITIVMNHKLDLKSNNNQGKSNTNTSLNNDGVERIQIDTSEKNTTFEEGTKTPYSSINKKPTEGSLNTFGNIKTNGFFSNGLEDAKLAAMRGSDSSSKRRKTAKETPSRSNPEGKQRLLEKKASRISASERRTPFKSKSEQFLPQTPAKAQKSDTLPDIPTDDEEIENKESKILQTWAHTPELHRLMMKNKDINPASVFGEIPTLNIEEVFENSASRIRGNQSPSRWSPEEKKKK